MSGEEFFNVWVEYVNDRIKSDNEWKTKYNGPKSWSNLLGFSDKSVGKAFEKKLPNYLSYSEYLRFDVVLTSKSAPNEIEFLKGKDTQELLPCDIVIEHENDWFKCHEEFSKLLNIRAKLKVLITYTKINNESDIFGYCKEMTKRADEYFDENLLTEYLVIIGRMDNNILVWCKDVF